jgi:hypothetical protein
MAFGIGFLAGSLLMAMIFVYRAALHSRLNQLESAGKKKVGQAIRGITSKL